VGDLDMYLMCGKI